MADAEKLEEGYRVGRLLGFIKCYRREDEESVYMYVCGGERVGSGEREEGEKEGQGGREGEGERRERERWVWEGRRQHTYIFEMWNVVLLSQLMTYWLQKMDIKRMVKGGYGWEIGGRRERVRRVSR